MGDSAPDFTMEFIDGTKHKLSDFRGRSVMLQFTASWCSVCRKEMPHIESDIWQVYKDKNVMVIGIDRDEPKDVVEKFAEDMKVTYPLALDPGAEIFSLFATKDAGVTRNILIDKEGKIVFLTRLFDMDEFSELISKIDTLANSSAETSPAQK